MIPAPEALRRLREGNRRFVSERSSLDALLTQARRVELASGQRPFAIVLGCSDSRVPVEIVFDQGLGDLFVIRVAGNIAAPSQIGSVEFAAAKLGARLAVVLGHSGCGAVLAALEELERPAASRSHGLDFLIDRVQASIADLELEGDPDARARAAVRANVRASADRLRHGSPVLESLIADEGFAVVGAEYDLETGVVDFFDGVPEAG